MIRETDDEKSLIVPIASLGMSGGEMRKAS
jgi:hypothetical protein